MNERMGIIFIMSFLLPPTINEPTKKMSERHKKRWFAYRREERMAEGKRLAAKRQTRNVTEHTKTPTRQKNPHRKEQEKEASKFNSNSLTANSIQQARKHEARTEPNRTWNTPAWAQTKVHKPMHTQTRGAHFPWRAVAPDRKRVLQLRMPISNTLWVRVTKRTERKKTRVL